MKIADRFRQWLVGDVKAEIQSVRDLQFMRFAAVTESFTALRAQIGCLPKPQPFPEIPDYSEKLSAVERILAIEVRELRRALDQFLDGESKANKESMAIVATAFDSVGRRISDLPKPVDHSADFHALRDAVSWPRLSSESLLAWEAVCYGASKWERDPQAPEIREQEILDWAGRWLSEANAAVQTPLLMDLLRIRDGLRKTSGALVGVR